MNGGAMFNNFCKMPAPGTCTFLIQYSIKVHVTALFRSPCTQFIIAYGGLDSVLCTFNISIRINTGGGARWRFEISVWGIPIPLGDDWGSV